MRLLRLRVDGRREVDLHPHLSVVTGLDPGQAAVLRRAAVAIGCGVAPRAGGLVEAGGFLLDAVPADLDLLGLGADPCDVVLTAVGLAGSAHEDPDLADRVRAAERDVLLLATDRRWAALARDATRDDPAPDARDLVRAEQLRLAVAAHDATDVEPLRRALDADRDAVRAGASTDDQLAEVVAELAALGLDVRSHVVEDDEVRRCAEDVLDEHLRHEAWAVGARVELDGLERRLRSRLRPVPPTGAATASLLPESGERRAERAEAALLDAIARADDLREEARGAGIAAAEVAEALVRRVVDRPREPAVGAVPLVLDRLVEGWSDDDVVALLEQLEPLSRGVQLLVLDAHPAAVGWARDAGTARAAVVAPTPAPAAGAPPTMRRTPT